MIYAAPGAAGAKVQFKAKYDNFINGQWTPPVKGQYFDVVTPISGKPYTQAARSTAEDIERLKSQLSPKAQEDLEKAKSEGHLPELAEAWMRAAMFSRFAGPPVDREQLRKFYEEVVLLEQKYVKDPDRTIQDYLNELTAKIGEKIIIRRFSRFQLGGE